ncbi:MAG: hypothetical protein OEX76_03150, partial [Candidatus Bathyarchaeota archaeon]|nr:hypothetical protein [Candidatus Bathyarchaeota archaeon]
VVVGKRGIQKTTTTVPLSRSGFSTAVESVGFDPNGHGLYLDHIPNPNNYGLFTFKHIESP